MGAAVWVPADVFADPPHVALTINNSISVQDKIMNFLQVYEVLNFVIWANGPFVLTLRCHDRAVNRDCHVEQIVDLNWHHMES